jgi:hypothetical protein
MSESNWHIVWVNFEDSEPGAIFIDKTSPDKSFISTWGGVASPEESDDIKKWVISNNKNIPEKLASCFVWYVTTGRY